MSETTTQAAPSSPSPPDIAGDGALIGVCGVPGAGKSVFLTCVYQSLDAVLPPHGELTFDRKDVGGARYFEQLEDEIRTRGSIGSTSERIRARLFLKIDDPSSELRGEDLPIDVVDFAGLHFNLLADLGPSLGSGELSEEERREAQAISSILERCDALVILVNAAAFRQEPGKPSENPFPRSVTSVVEDCRRRRRPVALVFSQADTHADLTPEQVEEFGRVRRFRQHFTSSLEEALEGKRPYGLVQLLTCYERGPGGLPKPQSAEGSIWRPEAGQVFLKLLGAAWPAVKERLERRCGDAERRRARAERKVEQPRIEGSPRGPRRLPRTAAAFLLLTLLATASYFGYQAYRERASRPSPETGTADSEQLEPAERIVVERMARASTVIERCQAIRGLLHDESLPDGEEFRLELRRELARRLVSSILEIEENPAVRRALEDAVDGVKFFASGPLRLELVYREIDHLDTLEGISAVEARAQRSLPSIETLARARRAAVENALSDLLAGLSADQRGVIWREVLAALESGYLFDLTSESSLAAVKPLPRTLAEVLGGGAPSRLDEETLQEDLLGGSIYRREIDALTAHIATRYFSHRLIAAYRTALNQLSAENAPDPSAFTQLLAELDRLMPANEPRLASAPDGLGSRREELERVIELVGGYQRSRGSLEKRLLESYLTRLIEKHCQAILELTSGACVEA